MLAELVPVPDSATVSGLPGALLATDRVPLAEPAAVGVNVTLTVQERARGERAAAGVGLAERAG